MKRKIKKYTENTRVEQKKETQSLILESAKTHFEKSGFEKATLRAIAADANVGIGSIFNYFPNKPSLLIAALLDDLEKVEHTAFQSIPDDASVVDACVHVADVFYTYYVKRISLSRILIKESNFIQGEFGELLVSRTNNFVQRVQDAIAASQKKGEVRKEADCGLAAETYFAIFLRHLLAGLNAPEFDVQGSLKSIRKLMEQYLAGIG